MHSQPTKNPGLGRPGFFEYTGDFVHKIVDTAQNALRLEVLTTPKPGLVDRNNNGSHRDMDMDMFFASTEAIAPFLGEMAALGLHHGRKIDDGLFPKLREAGIRAEKEMFASTNGVNTHKGMIFSMGTICGAAGWYYRRFGKLDVYTILKLCGKMTSAALERDLAAISHTKRANHAVKKGLSVSSTHGENAYGRYGIKGVRGEVLAGFPTVRELSLPRWQKSFKKTVDENDVCVQTLLHLMAHVDDTCVISRGGIEALAYVKEAARRTLAAGGIFAPNGVQILEDLDQAFISKNLSPGGSADMLAVTIFCGKLLDCRTDRKHDPVRI